MAEAPWRQAAAPTPPPGVSGHMPATRLKSEISDRRVEPPLCVQNAMLTKDKKPFTYTPGGIDLSEIRSPRMARRLERNAMSEGVAPSQQAQAPHQPVGQLPPSALAAMQPQLPVQVFPSGGVPQLNRGGPPPPPPPPSGIPAPPKPPPMKSTSPLLKDAFERPDMTKIIPENPMAMLRKTAGPVIKRDPIFNQNNHNSVDYAQAQPTVPKVQPQPVRQPSLESPKASTGIGSIYIPPVNQNVPPATTPQRQPQPIHHQQVESPPVAPSFYKRQPEAQSPPVVSQRQGPPTPTTPQTPETPKANLNKAPTPWLTQRRQQSQDVPEWAINDQRDQEWQPNQIEVQEPVHNQNVPPWRQQQQQQQPEVNSWQQRQPEPQLWQRPQVEQPRPQQVGGVKKQVQNRETPLEAGPVERTEVVIVSEPPQVFQHPGQVQQRVAPRQQPPHNPNQQQHGVRIIPVQIEGATSNGQVRSPQGYVESPNTPNSDVRSFNRQLSWNSTPTQSNTFRVLQKITQTDGDDEDDQPVTAHSPKMPHQFPQRQMSTEQMRKANSGDQELMNKFKQVPQVQQNNNRGPKVRTIPIEMEGEGTSKPYVPPSEQTVQEPKKYMGSSIPSRSFKMLQAMTAPNDCANPERACENNESYPNDPSSYPQWGFDPNFPPPPYYYDPYWSYYAQNFPNFNGGDAQTCKNGKAAPETLDFDAESARKANKNSRSTPIPWSNDGEMAKKQNLNPRCTPLPFWQFYYPNPANEQPPGDSPSKDEKPPGDQTEQQHYVQYPPYWDPYYYGYYYGAPSTMYPPVYSPYPFYPPQQSDAEEVSGYSSTDEMAYYGARFASMPPFANNNLRPVQLSATNVQKTDNDCNAKTTKNSKPEKIRIQSDPFEDDSSVADTSDSDTEMIGYEVCRKSTGLQTIRSVSDIKVYDAEESSQCSDEEESDNTTEENDDASSSIVADETIPHQLSVIFEESERTDSDARQIRESSVATTISEGTATVGNSEDEANDESDGTVFVKLPLTFKFTVADSQKVTTLMVGNSEVLPQFAKKSTVQELCDNLDAHVSSVKTDIDDKENNLNNDMNIIKQADGSVVDQQVSTESNDNSNYEDNDIDWWGELSKSEEAPLSSIKAMPDSDSKQSTSDQIEIDKNLNVEIGENTTKITINDNESPSSEEVDFWAQIMDSNTEIKTNVTVDNVKEAFPRKKEVDASSTCSSNSSLSRSNVSCVTQNSITKLPNSEESHKAFNNRLTQEENIKTEDGSRCSNRLDSRFECSDISIMDDAAVDESALPASVQERIKVLQAAAVYKQNQPKTDDAEIVVSIKERISVFEDTNVQRQKIVSRKNSIKSFEEYSEEEEGDSGVTSDVSRHISETEADADFCELKKSSKYQRASTHSRLFKLLQDECDNEDDDEPDQTESMLSRREHLNLPLKQPGSDPESFSSSGFTSPGSPTINDKLVNELIQTLLMRKQGRVFKNVTMEKLHAAALRILQEDMDGLETLSSSEDGSSFVSPKKSGTNSSTPVRTPQEYYANFNEYSQYYESWAEAQRLYEAQCDILPSKTFRLIQEHAAMNKTGAVAGLLARCPRVLSNKNVQKELMKLIENGESPCPSPEPPEQPPDTQEVTSAS